MKKLLLLVIVSLAALGSAYGVYAGVVRQVKEVPATVTVELVGPPGVCGDQNDDGQVNIFDAIIDLQIIAGLIEPDQQQQVLSDVVRDGAINIFDVILTLQHIAGLTVITECGPLPG